MVKEKGETRKSVGSVAMLIPFTVMAAILDEQFTVTAEIVPILLLMKDMVDNGLDISIQE